MAATEVGLSRKSARKPVKKLSILKLLHESGKWNANQEMTQCPEGKLL